MNKSLNILWTFILSQGIFVCLHRVKAGRFLININIMTMKCEI